MVVFTIDPKFAYSFGFYYCIDVSDTYFRNLLDTLHDGRIANNVRITGGDICIGNSKKKVRNMKLSEVYEAIITGRLAVIREEFNIEDLKDKNCSFWIKYGDLINVASFEELFDSDATGEYNMKSNVERVY